MSRTRLLLLLAALTLLGSTVSLNADVLAYASAQTGSATSSFGVLDLTTGAFSQIATLNVFLNDLTLSPNGTLYVIDVPFTGSSNSEFGTINPATGAITNIAPNTVGLNSIDFSGNGTLFGTSFTNMGPEGLYSISPATGATSFIANLSGPLSTTANQLRFIGNTAYTTSFTTPSGLYTIDLATGAGTLVGNTGLNQNNGLGAVVNGQLVDIAGTSPGARIFDINPTTGAATPGATVDRFYVFTLETAEPDTATLVGCALGCFLAALLMRKIAGRLLVRDFVKGVLHL
jgi:hypothetical protein